ncbi:MAG: hypothetical protein IJI82_04815, partial [Clostridia bacterium]|nr:hypothetical protein [Clostridia bacterium]
MKMKLFWMKNKVLIATLLAVLVLGVAFWGGLRLFEGERMQDVLVRTSFAEAEATATPTEEPGTVGLTGDDPTATLSPYPLPVRTDAPLQTAMPAELVSEDILHLEWRYKDIFPRITNTYSYQAKTWKEGDKVDDALADAARRKVKDVFYELFNDGGDYHDFDNATVVRYVDESGYRENVLRITGANNDFACVLAEKDLSLLIADNAKFPATAAIHEKEDAKEVAQYLGVTLGKGMENQGGSRQGRDGDWIERFFGFELSDGRWITLCYTMNTLHGVQVHQDRYSMQEGVCFQADIRHSPEVVHLVAEENFVQGDPKTPAEGDMTVDEIMLMYRNFLSAANGRASGRRDAEGKTVEELDYNLKDWEITYFLDKSGYRENFYRIHKEDLVDMDIAAKSGYIVRATCDELYNPDDDLKLIDIDYDHMGGVEYIH